MLQIYVMFIENELRFLIVDFREILGLHETEICDNFKTAQQHTDCHIESHCNALSMDKHWIYLRTNFHELSISRFTLSF